MENGYLIAIISGLAGAIITSIFSLSINNKNIVSQNIIKERAKWRSDIRKISKNISECIVRGDFLKLRLFRDQIQLKLNPIDEEDIKIIRLLDDYIMNHHYFNDSIDKRFTLQISLLLKHDWERAKLESTLFKKTYMPLKRGKICSNGKIEFKFNKHKILSHIISFVLSFSITIISTVVFLEKFIALFIGLKIISTIAYWLTIIITYLGIVIFTIWLIFFIVFRIFNKKKIIA